MLKILSGKVATSEEARRMLRYVELLSDTRLMLGKFFCSLLTDSFVVGKAAELCLDYIAVSMDCTFFIVSWIFGCACAKPLPRIRLSQ